MLISGTPVLLGSGLSKHMQGFRFSLWYTDYINKNYCRFSSIHHHSSSLQVTGNQLQGTAVSCTVDHSRVLTVPYFLHSALYFYYSVNPNICLLFFASVKISNIVASSDVLCYYHFFCMCHHTHLLSHF